MSGTAASEQEPAIDSSIDPLTPTAASEQEERRLEDLAQFVQKWHKENGCFVLGEEQVQNACQEGYADGLTLSQNLKALGPVFDAENAPSFEDTEAIKERLREEKLPTKLLHEYYLRFFSSLRITENVAKIAVTSEALSEANNFFDPTKYMSESLDMETLTKFWASAAPDLAAMTLAALKAKKTFTETQHSDKFRDVHKLEGELDAFYLGLVDVIGQPRQDNLMEAMEKEHASEEAFSAWNQGHERHTSPNNEWERVLPEGIDGPVNTKNYEDTQDLCKLYKSNFEEHPMVKKADLERAEVVALRLYTSPMYSKYNAELRNLLEAFLHLQDRSTSGSLRTRHGVALHSETSALTVEEARQSMECVGYVTTIHAIVSGLIKLSKVGEIVGRAYCGIHGKSIPSCLLLPGASGPRRGVEYGFMSMSKSKLAAMSYASAEGADGMPLVFEILTGAVDRGADLSWISYFPGEEEILLPPLSYLELAGFPRYEAIAEIEEEASRTASSSAGKLVMIIPLQVKVNLKGFTLDQLRRRRKDLHIQTFENLISEVEHALEPEAVEEERPGPSPAIRQDARTVFLGGQGGIWWDCVRSEIMPNRGGQKSEPASVGGGRRLSQGQIELGGGIWWDCVRSEIMPNRGGQKQSKTARNDFIICRDVVLKQCREVLQSHIRRDKLEFNDDIKYKEALDEALSIKMRAKRMLQVLLHRLGLDSLAVFERLKRTPLGELSVDYRYYPLLSGLEDNSADAKVEGFPWKNIFEGSWSAREVVLEKRTSEFLEHRISPFQLRLALQCISDHREVVQTLWYGSFCFQQQALPHRVELTPSRPIQAAEQDETDQRQLHSKEVPTITYGDLRICSISEDDPSYPSHETIQLRFCKTPLCHDGGLFICNVVLGSKDLVSLDLSGCKLFSAGSRYLAKGLQYCSPSLTRLDLRQCALGLGGGQAVLEALQGANLKTLSIGNNVLSPEGWSSLADCLQAASSLTSLDIAYCCLYSSSAPKLATALQGLEHLQILDICGSIMDKQIAASIAEAVWQLPALREVNKVKVGRGVSGEGVSESVWKDEKLYNFGEEDAGLVAAIIRTNTQLTQLNNLDPKHDCDGNDKTWVITDFLKMWKRSDAPIAFLQNQLARSDCEMQIKLEETTFGGAGDAERLKAHVEACIKAQNEGKVKAKAAHFDDRRRLLEVAAQKNDVEEVRLLQGAGSIGGGQGDNFDFSYGQRMLVQAGLSGGPEVCMCLIAGTEASRLELKDMEGRTSLMRAARDGGEAVVRTLIWKGANVNAEDSEGKTALMMAAGQGWDNVVEILLSCNANIEQRNREGWNVLHTAAMYATDRTVITLLEHATENAVSMACVEKGNTPLHYAATFGKQRIVCMLLAAKAPADCQSKTLRTPLMEASAGGNKYILDSLLQAKASVNSVDRSGTTALMEAAKKGHVDLVEKLALAAAEQGNEPPRTSMAAVREVLPRNASFGSLSSMLGFRRANSNFTKCINKQDEQMWTALMLAVSHSHANVALALLNLPPEHGLDVNLAQHEGRTALMLAAANGLRADHQNRQNPKPEDTRVHPRQVAEIVPLVLPSEHTREFLVTILVEKNADIAARDKTGRTALIEAARNGHCEVVEKLLSLDADPNAKTNNKWTALMFAADKGHASVVDVLLNRKVDIDVKGKDGRTALDLAVRKGHESVVKSLSVLETNSQRPYDQGMVIVPYEVPRRFLPYLAARDKYDLMHNRGQAISFRLDTKVFQIEPLNELFQTNIKSTLKKLPTSLEMLSSPLAAVTLKGEARATADIPEDACYFSFCYPTTLFEKLDHFVFANSDDNSVVFLRNGAFVYYNSTYDIIKLNALHVYEKMHSPEAGLSFDTDLPMHSTSVEYLERWNRWTVVTVEFLREKGFTHFAWINPGEVLGESYFNPHGGFAYRNADRTAVFYPVCLDGDANVLTAPAAPFTCKVDGTSDEDSMSDIESDSEQQGSLGTGRVPGMSRVRSSKSLEQADGTDSVVKSRQRRKEAISGVTGLLEVRTEVVQKLLDHLLSYAKEERERLSKHLVTQDGTELSPGDILQEFTFTADQPHTWTAHDLPVSADTDTPLEREEKLLQLAEMHARVPAERQLRMPLPFNLLQVSHFGPPDKRQSIADHLFCEDVDTLNRSRRRRIILYLNRDVLEWTSDRTKTYLSKSKRLRRIHPMVRETSASSASSGSKLSTPPSGTEQQFFKLVGSPLNQVTLPEDVQVRAGIPKQAKFYCFCYPVEELASKHRRTPTDALGSFLRLGGFLYFNEMYEVVSITALSVSAADKSETRCVLHLGPSLDLPTTAIKPLQRAKRWWPVTHKAAARLGYSHMAYICPCEVLADHVFCGHGGFVYCSAQHNKAHFYPVMSSFYDIDYGEEQRYRRRYQPRKFHMWIGRREGPALRAARPARFVNGSIPLLDHHHHQHHQQQQPHQPHGQHGHHRQPLPASPIIVEDQEALSAPAGEDSSEEEDVKEEALAAVRREVGAAECCAQLITGQTLAGLLERREATLAGLAKSELAALRVWTCGCSTSRQGFASTPGWQLTRALVHSGVGKLQRLAEDCSRILHSAPSPIIQGPSSPPRTPTIRSNLAGYEAVPEAAGPRRSSVKVSEEAAAQLREMALLDGVEQHSPLPPPGGAAGGAAGDQRLLTPVEDLASAEYLWAWKGAMWTVLGAEVRAGSGAQVGGGCDGEEADKLMQSLRGGWEEELCLAATKDFEVAAALIDSDGSLSIGALARNSNASLPTGASAPIAGAEDQETATGVAVEKGEGGAGAAGSQKDGDDGGSGDGMVAVLLRIKCARAEEMPADLSWLSSVPAEHEVLFAPGTLLQPLFAQRLLIRRSPDVPAFVVTCRPVRPTDQQRLASPEFGPTPSTAGLNLPVPPLFPRASTSSNPSGAAPEEGETQGVKVV